MAFVNKPGNFTQDPSQRAGNIVDRGAVAVHIGQGKPVLDADLNLLGDIAAESTRQRFAEHLGDGPTPGTDGFAILPISSGVEGGAGYVDVQDFVIKAGGYLLNGILFVNHGEEHFISSTETVAAAAGKRYSNQGVSFDGDAQRALLLPAGAGALQRFVPPLPSGARYAPFLVYLEGFLEEITAETRDNDGLFVKDPLANLVDVDVRTSVRTRASWLVQVAPTPLQLTPTTPTVAQAVEAAMRDLRQAAPPAHLLAPLAVLHIQDGSVFTIPRMVVEDLRPRRPLLVEAISRARAMEEALRPRVLDVTSSVETTGASISARARAPGATISIHGENLGRGVLELSFGQRRLPTPTPDNTPQNTTLFTDQRVASVPLDTSVDIRIVNAIGESKDRFFIGREEPVQIAKAPGVSALDIGAMGRSVWVVSKDGDVLKWTGSAFEPPAGRGVKATRIAAGPDETAWIVTPGEGIAFYEKGKWYTMPGKARDIGAGIDGSVFKIGRRLIDDAGGYEIAQWTGNRWIAFSGAARRIAVLSHEEQWGIDRSNRLLRCVRGTWSPVHGVVNDIPAPSPPIPTGILGTDVGVQYNPGDRGNPAAGGYKVVVGLGSVPVVVNFAPLPAPAPQPLVLSGGILVNHGDSAWDHRGGDITVGHVAVDVDGVAWLVDAGGNVYGHIPQRVEE